MVLLNVMRASSRSVSLADLARWWEGKGWMLLGMLVEGSASVGAIISGQFAVRQPGSFMCFCESGERRVGRLVTHFQPHCFRILQLRISSRLCPPRTTLLGCMMRRCVFCYAHGGISSVIRSFTARTIAYGILMAATHLLNVAEPRIGYIISARSASLIILA